MLEQSSAQRNIEIVTNVVMPWPLDDFLSKQGIVQARDADRRRFARLYYRTPVKLHISQSLPAIKRKSKLVNTYSCDISREGVGFLCDRELYPKELIQITLNKVGDRQVQVMRCRKLSKYCFEIGGKFVGNGK
jgi:hypothetical protein